MLLAFREQLARELAPSTADTYYKAIDYLLNDQFLIDCRKLNVDRVVLKLKAMRYKNQYSKYKNAFIKLCDYLNIKLSDTVLTELDTISGEKKKKYRHLKPVRLEDIKNRIKVINDKKLKLSFETMLISGLRVSELSQMKKADCTIQDNSIGFKFITKGGNRGNIVIDDKQLVPKLKDLIGSTAEGERVFYSTNYLQTQANIRDFQCHDLRRAFSKLAYREHRDITKVMHLLRHSRKKSTKIYLKSKLEL